MSEPQPGAVIPTLDDARAFYVELDELMMKMHYAFGLTGSVLTAGHGHDMDWVIVATEDAIVSAREVAAKILRRFCDYILEYEQYDSRGARIGCSFVCKQGFVVDFYIFGLEEA